jgi:hypothetical protein
MGDCPRPLAPDERDAASTDMHPIFIELKDVSGVPLMVNVQNVNYIRPVAENETELHFGTGHPITVLHPIDDIRRLVRTTDQPA